MNIKWIFFVVLMLSLNGLSQAQADFTCYNGSSHPWMLLKQDQTGYKLEIVDEQAINYLKSEGIPSDSANQITISGLFQERHSFRKWEGRVLQYELSFRSPNSNEVRFEYKDNKGIWKSYDFHSCTQ